MKADEFKKIINKLVAESLRQQLRPLIKEVLGEIMVESMVNNNPLIAGNSNKGRMLREASYGNVSELEEYPTMKAAPPTLDRSRIAALMGLGDQTEGITPNGMITVSHANSLREDGNPVPIDPNSIAPEVIEAMNRDYRPLIQAWERKKNNG